MHIIVSVVIPIYNVDLYLRQCLDSLGVLGRKDIEIILVNDGSTDSCRDICIEYKEKWSNIVFVDKENGGLSDARNKGTEVASGDFIYYVDSDDWLAPNAIDKLYQFALKQDCEVVQGSFYYAFDDHVQHINRYYKSDDDTFVLNRHDTMQELIKNNYVKNFAWGKLYKTSIVKRHPFPVGKFFEDSYWQHLIIHDCTRYGVICEPLYFYRQRENSISSVLGKKYLDLVLGLESRLMFIKEYYPELTTAAADALWTSAFSMRGRSAEINQLFKIINQKYSSLFSSCLKQSRVFILAEKDSMWLPFYLFYRRVEVFFERKSKGLIKLPK